MSNATLAKTDQTFPTANTVSNLGINYDVGSGTFTVNAADGTALSTGSPGVVVLQSKTTPGETVEYKITANQDFIDDNGASEIIGNLFGLTSGVAYSEDIPFYLYAVSNDAQDTIQFMISRVGARKTSPVSGEIGDPSSAVADEQFSFFSFDDIDQTLFDSNPCLLIGSFRMQMSASDDWNVQTINNSDGIGQFQEEVVFTLPTGVYGAVSGSHFKNNGGTAPQFATQNMIYMVRTDGRCTLGVNQSQVNSAGAGAVDVQMIVPFTRYAVTNGLNSVKMRWNDSGVSNVTIMGFLSSTVNQGSFWQKEALTTNLLNSDLQAGDSLNAQFSYAMRLE